MSPGSNIRVRMLNCLNRADYFTSPQLVRTAPVRDLLNIRNFGLAALYECRDWLAENGLSNPEIEAVIQSRHDNGFPDPRAATRQGTDE